MVATPRTVVTDLYATSASLAIVEELKNPRASIKLVGLGLLSYIFQVMDSQAHVEDPPPSRFDLNSQKIQDEGDDWGTKVTAGILAGMIYGGIKEGQASSHWQPFLPSQVGSSTWNERQKAWRNVWEQRTLRVAGGTVSGGAKLGLFTAMFCGTQKALKIYRDVDDALNTVAAASSTAAMLGLVLPGSLKWRIRTSLLGAVLGAVVGYPLGYLQSFVDQKADVVKQELEKNSPPRILPPK